MKRYGWFKRAVSLALALAMFCGVAGAPPALFAAHAEGAENLLRNPGFETADAEWSHGADGYTGDDAHGGSASRDLSLIEGKSMFQVLTPDNTPAYDSEQVYTLTVWVKNLAQEQASLVLRRESKAGDDVKETQQEYQIAGGDWQQVSLELPATGHTKSFTEALLHFTQAGDAGRLLVDDAELVPQSSTPPEPEEPNVWQPSQEDKTPGAEIAHAGGFNMLGNPGFEREISFAEWGGERVQAVSDPAYTHSGAKGAVVAANLQEAAYQYTGVTVPYDYSAAAKAGVWLYLEKPEDAQLVSLFLERPNAAEGGPHYNVEAKPEGKTGWQKVELAAGALAEGACKAHTLKVEVRPGNAGRVYFDDAYVVPGNEALAGLNWLRNPSFEDGNNAWSAYTAVEGGRSGKAVELTQEAATFQASGWWGTSRPGYAGEAAMQFSVWAKSASGEGKLQLRAELKEGKGDISREFTLPAGGEWEKYVLEVPQTNGVTEALFHIKAVQGTLLVDDAALTLAETGGGSEPDPDLPDDGLENEPDKQPGVLLPGVAGENLVQNPGFEEPGEDHKANWGVINGASINTNRNYTHGGAYSVVCEGGGNMWNVLPASQDPNEATLLSAWVYLRNAADAAKVRIYLKREKSGGELIASYDAPALQAQIGWQQVQISIPARAEKDATQLVVVADVGPSLAGKVYLDDFFVKKSEKAPVYTDGYLTNPGFERVNATQTEVNNWGLMPGWNTVPGAVCMDTVHEGSYSVRIPQGDVERELLQSTNWIDTATTRKVDPSEPMLLSVWVKYENITGEGIWLRSERKKGSESFTVQGQALTGSSAGWVKLELYIPPNEGGMDECLTGLRVMPGKGRVWVDDMNLEPTAYQEPDPESLKGSTEQAERLYGADALQSGANWLTNPGFEQDMLDWGTIGGCQVVSDSVHGGKKAMMFQSEAHLWNNAAFEMDKSAEYVLSFWVKLSAPSDAEFVQFYVDRKDSGDELIRKYVAYAAPHDRWQQIVMRIPAEKHFSTRHLVVGMDTLARLDPVYLDDFYLTRALHNPPLDNYIANGSFELGDSGKDKWGAIPDWGNGIHVVDNVRYSGDRSLRIRLDGGESRNLFQASTWGGAQQCPADKNTILSVFLYSPGGITGDGVLVKAERKYKDQLVGEPLLSQRITGRWKGWQLVEVYMPSTDQPVEELIVGLEAAPGTGTVYVDSWGLYLTDRPAPPALEPALQNEPSVGGVLLKNPGVEELNPDGTVTHWDVWPGDPAEGERRSYASTEVRHSGERSVCVELVYSNPQAIYQYRVPTDDPFPFNEDYVFSAWVKTEGLSVVDDKGFKIGVKRRGADGQEYNQYESVPMGTYDWTKVEITVPKAEGVDIVQYDVIFDMGCGSGKVYFDDFELTPASLTQAPPELSFEKETGETAPFTGPAAQPAQSEGAPLWPFAAVGGLAVAALGVVGLAAHRGKKRGRPQEE